MLLRVPTAIILLTVVMSFYFNFVKAVSFNSDVLIGSTIIFLTVQRVFKNITKLKILILIIGSFILLCKESEQIMLEEQSYLKDIKGILFLESTGEERYKKKNLRVYKGRIICLPKNEKAYINKRATIYSDIHRNLKVNEHYSFKGKLAHTEHNKSNLYLELTEIDAIKYTHKITDFLFDDLGLEKPNQAFLKAFLFGDKSELTEQQKESFVYSGTMHLFAVSGLHIGCLYFALSLLLRALCFSQFYRMIYAMIVLYGYLYLVNFSISSTRAYIMLCVWVISKIIGIRSSPFSIVCLTGIILLIIDPQNIISIGFIFSISVVLSIIWITDNSDYSKTSKPLGKFIQLCLVNYAAFWGSFIVLAKVFGLIVPVSLLSNMVLIPVVSILMPFSFLGLILLQIPLFTFITPFIEFPLSHIINLCAWFSDLSWSTFSFNSSPQIFDWRIYAIIIILIISFGIFKKPIIKLVFLPILITAILLV